MKKIIIFILVTLLLNSLNLHSQIKVWSNGKVGINTLLEPKEIFQIGTNWTFTNIGNKCINYNTYWDVPTSKVKRISNGFCSSIDFNNDGSLAFRVGSNGTAGDTVRMNNVLKVTNDQKVGIGVDFPQEKLEVNGNIKIGNSNNIFFISNGSIINSDSNHSLIFGNYPNNIMSLCEYGDIHFKAGYNNGGTSAKMIVKANGQVSIGGNPNTNYKFTIYGDAFASNGTWVASDKRYKMNIKRIDGALGKVLKMNGKSYNYNREEFKNLNFNEGTTLGFIAQELKEVLPEAVKEDNNGYYSINYEQVIPILVEAIKDQQGQIERLQNCCDQSFNFNIKPSTTNNGNNIEVAKLEQNNPNPFSEITEIKCYIPKNSVSAAIYIYDIQGKQIKKIQINNRGEVNATLLGSELKAGMYLYTLIIDSKEIDTKKMILTN